ncbi:hypothetical protein MUP46_02175 [Patescibacteria group bacterium]|nr:hypothetical protein [Patescibacteria group bacterium]
MKRSPTQTYQDIAKDRIGFEFLRNKLKLKHLQEKDKFSKKFPHAAKFFESRKVDLGKIRQHSAAILGAGALTGTLLLAPSTGFGSLSVPKEILQSAKNLSQAKGSEFPQKLLLDSISQVLPKKPQPLNRSQEKTLEQLFKNIIGVTAKGTLEGEHLNTTYGLIGAEQHLYRYPGDNITQHGTGQILKEGIAPGLGAWGYFAPSADKLSPQLAEDEKWYAVVQTLYLPDWNKRLPYLRDWYKYRKVLIVNTDNGNAVVAAIADSGPAAWTGKHFGGSPEVMEYLGGPRYKKGPVVLFFVDDPENKVPLGPVEYNKINLPQLALSQV